MPRWLVAIAYRIPGTMRFKEDVVEVTTLTSQLGNEDVAGLFRVQYYHLAAVGWFIREIVYDGRR